MPRACTVCSSPSRASIDSDLVTKRGSIRGVARRYGLSPDAVERHAKAHLPRALAASEKVREEVRAEDLAAKAQRLEEDARRLLARAEKEGDLRCAVAAVKAALDVLTLLRRVSEDQRAAARDVLRSPSWLRLKSTILVALAPHPAALADVVRAIGDPRGAETSPFVDQETEPAVDMTGLGLRAANVLAGVFARNPKALAEEEEPKA